LEAGVALKTINDYVCRARGLLQDLVAPYRYSDALLMAGLNLAMGEISRIRPDIVLADRYSQGTSETDQTVPFDELVFDSIVPSDDVPVPPQHRMALLMFMVGYAQLHDNEDVEDARAAALLNKFVAQLLTVAA
jgi:predicted HAD superfamily phosphohydrolase